MAAVSEDGISKRCAIAAFALAFAHVLTFVGTEYQVGGPARFHSDGSLFSMYVLSVNYYIFLSPVIILLALRKACVVQGIFAFPVVIFFVLRMHNVWEFYWLGINSMARQKGDELAFVTLVFDMISAGLAGLLLLSLLVWRLIVGAQRVWKR